MLMLNESERSSQDDEVRNLQLPFLPLSLLSSSLSRITKANNCRLQFTCHLKISLQSNLQSSTHARIIFPIMHVWTLSEQKKCLEEKKCFLQPNH
ncbi:CLUMA_CG014933, isoform A [Clunio marinus]|uniref:CLUMA_CG014933, isoform A n=1 Tax=Clunio marinus TaxID=568069 RepID=A0A1J1INB2_9DIPT|nr:CLUMA_CG014933, isoform A [Clunio marinus]